MSKGISAKKRDRQNERRRQRNRATLSRLRTVVKKTSAEPTPDNLSESYSVLDRAVRKNVLHRKRVARMKSNLAKRTAK